VRDPFRADDFRTKLFLERKVAAAMVQMMMRVEDMGELQPAFRQRFPDWFRLRRIDDGDRTRSIQTR